MASTSEFNKRLGNTITNGVGTMWAAYLFCALALVSLPAAIATGSTIIIIAWVAQTFLQLVLLPIIIVGQNIQAESVNQKIIETHTASLAEFELAKTAAADARAEISELKAIAAAVHAAVVGVDDPQASPSAGNAAGAAPSAQ